MRFAIVGLLVVIGMWFAVVVPAQNDAERNRAFDCVLATKVAHNIPLEYGESVWSTYHEACAKAGNPATGV